MPVIDTQQLTKLYYSIGEVSDLLDVNASLLRFWEKEFDLKVSKRNKKGNRLYAVKEIEEINKIYALVTVKLYTLDGAKKAMNFLFGTDFENQDAARKSMVKNLVDALEPLNNIDMTLVGKLDSLSGALRKFVSNLNALKSVSMKGFEKNVKDMMQGMALQIAVLDKMANGGKVGTGYFDGIPETDFGKGFLSPASLSPLRFLALGPLSSAESTEAIDCASAFAGS